MIILLLQVLLIFIHNPNMINTTDRKETRIIFKLRNEPDTNNTPTLLDAYQISVLRFFFSKNIL